MLPNKSGKSKTHINFCVVDFLKVPKQKFFNKKPQKITEKNISFLTNSYNSVEKETKAEITIEEEKDKIIKKLNIQISQLEKKVRELETELQLLKASKKSFHRIHLSRNNTKDFIPIDTYTLSNKKKSLSLGNSDKNTYLSQNTHSKQKQGVVSFIKNFSLLRAFSLGNIKTKKNKQKANPPLDLSLTKSISKKQKMNLLLHRISKEKPKVKVFTLKKERSNSQNFSKTIYNIETLNACTNNTHQIPKAPYKSIMISTKEMSDEMNKIKKRTKALITTLIQFNQKQKEIPNKPKSRNKRK